MLEGVLTKVPERVSAHSCLQRKTQQNSPSSSSSEVRLRQMCVLFKILANQCMRWQRWFSFLVDDVVLSRDRGGKDGNLYHSGCSDNLGKVICDTGRMSCCPVFVGFFLLFYNFPALFPALLIAKLLLLRLVTLTPHPSFYGCIDCFPKACPLWI